MFRCALVVLIGCGYAASQGWASVGQNVVVLLDDSGSMAEPMHAGPRIAKIDAAKRALLQVLEQLPDDAQVGVLALNSRSAGDSWIIPLGPINRRQVQQAISRIRADGGTPLGAAMKQATDVLLERREKQFYGDYRLLIVTDGEAQDKHLVEEYLPDILSRQITVDVIGVSMAQNHSLATRVDRYRRADDPDSLREAIRESLAETPLDPQDPDEASDFELLLGLPQDVAVSAIEILSRADNRPIGLGDAQVRDVPTYGSPSSQPQAASPPPVGSLPAPPSPPATGISKVLIFGIILLVMVMLKSVMRAGRRRRS